MKKATRKQAPRHKKQNIIVHYFYLHKVAAHQGLQQLGQQTLLNTMIIFVMGITMALPSLLGISFNYLHQYESNWQQGPQAAIYLTTETTATTAQALVNQLQQLPHIQKITFISPEQGLDQFKAEANLGTALDELEENPIPGVILIEPSLKTDQTTFQHMLTKFEKNPAIDSMELNTSWINKLISIMQLGKNSLILIAALLGTSMLLVVCNMVYLVLQRYRNDIEVYLLVGATRRFIRRPYLYMGLYYGSLSTVCSWAILACCYEWLQPALTSFSHAYGLKELNILASMPPMIFFGISLGAGLLLGLLGARLAAWQYLRQQQS